MSPPPARTLRGGSRLDSGAETRRRKLTWVSSSHSCWGQSQAWTRSPHLGDGHGVGRKKAMGSHTAFCKLDQSPPPPHFNGFTRWTFFGSFDLRLNVVNQRSGYADGGLGVGELGSCDGLGAPATLTGPSEGTCAECGRPSTLLSGLWASTGRPQEPTLARHWLAHLGTQASGCLPS